MLTLYKVYPSLVKQATRRLLPTELQPFPSIVRLQETSYRHPGRNPFRGSP